MVRTPYRISFAGGGTDFAAWFTEQPGSVVSATINRYSYLTLRQLPPFFPFKSRFVWSCVEKIDDLEAIQHPSIKSCLKFMGIDKPAIQIHHDGDLPAQSGMGTSASFTVGLLHGLHVLRGLAVSPRELAKHAMHVDQDLTGEVAGCQDHVAAAHGGLNHVKFGPERHDYSLTRLPLHNGKLVELQEHLLLLYTKTRDGKASEIEAAKWQNRPLPAHDVILRDQQALVAPTMDALEAGDHEELARLLREGWALKRAMSFAVDNDHALDCFRRAAAAGAKGGKLLGAGGGGCLLLVAPPESKQAVCEALPDCVPVPFEFEHQGSQLIYYEPQVLA